MISRGIWKRTTKAAYNALEEILLYATAMVLVNLDRPKHFGILNVSACYRLFLTIARRKKARKNATYPFYHLKTHAKEKRFFVYNT
ncbi:uncharacterized protein PHALS_07521 [Plasmopara halstedii]|uniref:Uncharacterized protein n=1 Tax=Plasmopara halstedii TaxID=4781 RepID=A0A0P1B4T9_PLAHL|nr:uncharacterized protein PHALS_07521 [Plasmopara halstedii]CEG49775.1 hypothetical protein PHALS_07521 [Plasmopara halstedii]|eukprot:XP_024586144.1 hypothetical protein PHALS_07521 [Plasmopara halstedii]